MHPACAPPAGGVSRDVVAMSSWGGGPGRWGLPRPFLIGLGAQRMVLVEPVLLPLSASPAAFPDPESHPASCTKISLFLPVKTFPQSDSSQVCLVACQAC